MNITEEGVEALRGWGAPYRPTRGVIFGADYTISAPRDYGGGNVHPEILNRFLRKFPLRFWHGGRRFSNLFDRLKCSIVWRYEPPAAVDKFVETTERARAIDQTLERFASVHGVSIEAARSAFFIDALCRAGAFRLRRC